MGIKVVQMASAPPPPTPTPRSDQPKGWRQRGPQATSEKPFLLSDGKVTLEANLDKAIYTHGDPVHVNISVRNTSKKAVRRIKVKTLHRPIHLIKINVIFSRCRTISNFINPFQ